MKRTAFPLDPWGVRAGVTRAAMLAVGVLASAGCDSGGAAGRDADAGGNGHDAPGSGSDAGTSDAGAWHADASDDIGWQTVIAGDWTLEPRSERYVCVRKTLDRDTTFGAMRAINPLGTHHTLLTIGEPDAPDGVSDCDASVNHPLLVAGSGVGTNPLEFPAGVVMKVDKGQQLLLNLHLFNVGDQPLTGTSGTEVEPRAAADALHVGQAILAGTLRIMLPPGERTTVSGACTMGDDVTIFGVGPHMHQLGVHLKAVAESSVQGDVTLSDGPYDFENQQVKLVGPVEMKAGDRVRVDCTYENTTKKVVQFGDSSLAEMCFAGILRYPALDGFFICVQ